MILPAGRPRWRPERMGTAAPPAPPRRPWAHLAAGVFALLLLYPLTGMLARVGRWQWGGQIGAASLASIRVSLLLTALAMLIVVAVGTPAALYIRRASRRARAWWQAALLLSILLPALALGILLTLALRPEGVVGGLLLRLGMATSNSPAAFVLTQVYVSLGYYVLGALVALDAIPPALEQQAALLGLRAGQVFARVTLPLARLGLAAALSLAWVRAIGEFGAVVITAYYPAGMPVQLWIHLQSFGLPAVMPLLLAFLLAALPLPLLLHLLAQGRRRA
ncbi:MAG TPA: ABC transporter permease subunit [Terriglobales bacterium]|nr:ABC transporter permease subunit [Terriglobales bacterium]